MTFEMVVIGTSLGGLAALKTILGKLPTNFRASIAIVLHRHKDSDSSLTSFLQQFTPLPIHEVEDKDEIVSGHIYIAPPDYHLLVESGYFSLSIDDPVSYARPSIDVLFESAADVYSDRLIGVALTGANQDGARGLATIKTKGGMTIVQQPETAESPVLPQAAIATVSVDFILPLPEIASRLVYLCCPIEKL